MTRSALLAAAIAAVLAGGSRADDDPVKAKLAAAKEDYQKELAKLKGAVLEALDKAEAAARTTGDKAVVDRLKADRKAFTETGAAPAHPSGTGYNRDALAAAQKLERAYKAAATEYLKAKKDDESDAVEAEMRTFLATAPGVKSAGKDSYPTGTIWAGQLRWNADPGNHNYLIVITERAGKTFKGIARLDYGPSGDPKRKSLYDIEGEVVGMNLKYKGDLGGLKAVEGKWVKGGLQIHATAENGGVLSGTLLLKRP